MITATEPTEQKEPTPISASIPTDPINLAKTLADALYRLAEMQNDLEGIVYVRIIREMRLTPEGGFPGKAETDRLQAARAVFMADGEWVLIGGKEHELRNAIRTQKAWINGLEAMRKAHCQLTNLVTATGCKAAMTDMGYPMQDHAIDDDDYDPGFIKP